VRVAQQTDLVNRGWPLVLSARSENALLGVAARLGAWVHQHAKGNGSSPLPSALSYTLGARRNRHSHRLTMVARSTDKLVQELQGFSSGMTGSKVRTSFSPRREHPPRIGFVMSGQGPQLWGMGRELMQHEPVFRRKMETCAAAMRPFAQFDLLEELGRDESTSRMQQTEIGQPAIFAMQVALAELWKSV